ncbi:MAG: O-antigen ligase family protein [Bacteroidales bacterium]
MWEKLRPYLAPIITSIISVIIGVLCVSKYPLIGYALALFPFVLIFIMFVFNNPYNALIVLFIVNYLTIGVSRYVNIMPGIIFDAFLLLTLISFIVNLIFKKNNLKGTINCVTICSLIWLLYCIMMLFNPEQFSTKSWISTIRGFALYLFIIPILTYSASKDYSKVKTFIKIWSILTILAVLKALMQKYWGWDNAEKYWLFVENHKTTHIINSGIRYFSFMSDAANFGNTMGHSIVVFFITALVIKNKNKKIYYFIVSLLATWGLLLSGTRSALAVPFVGLAIYVILSKNKRNTMFMAVTILIIFLFFKFTPYGNGNQYIRRMRTVFNPEDTSLEARTINKKRFAYYLKDKPFGIGIGVSNGRAKDIPDSAKEVYNIPTDSWYVMIWVETGIIGLTLNIILMLIILIYGCWITWTKIKNQEVLGITISLIGGIAGIMVASYANEIYGQFPSCTIIYMSYAFILLSPKYDQEVSKKKANLLKNKDNEKKDIIYYG